jgi:hypothetical protein
VLNDLHIDIMDYIAPASCTDLAFRAMWAEFEWENKVAVNTDITEVRPLPPDDVLSPPPHPPPRSAPRQQKNSIPQ